MLAATLGHETPGLPSPPCPEQPGGYSSLLQGYFVPGGVEEPFAIRACEKCRSLSLRVEGGGWRGRQQIWRSQSRCWQHFKVWYLLSQPGICTYFLSSACYAKSVKI